MPHDDAVVPKMGWKPLGRKLEGGESSFTKEELKLCPSCKQKFAQYKAAGYQGKPPAACKRCAKKLKGRYGI